MISVHASARAALLAFALLVCAATGWAQPVTPAYRVKDIDTEGGFGSLGVTGTGLAAGAVYFGSYSADLAFAQLWRTDGTAAGTRPVRDFGTTATDAPATFTSVPSGAFFFARGSLWQIDASGVAAELREVGGAPTSRPVALGDTILFVMNGGDDGGKLWRSDGSATGTLLLDGATTGFQLPAYADLTSANGRVFFSAFDTFGGWGLWSTDGTQSGTTRVRGLVSPIEGAVATADGLLLFVTQKDLDRTTFQLWRSDGSAAGTFAIHEFIGEFGACPMSCPPYGPSDLTQAGDRVVFAANDGVHGHGLWSTDGTATGTSMIAGLPPYGVSFLSTGAIAYYSGEDPEHGDELWRTDGTAAGTFRVADLVQGPDSTYAYPFAAFGHRCVFLADALGELWITDGSSAGTYSLGETDHAGFYPYGFTPYGDVLLYVQRGQLWKTDGTPAGTRRVDGIASMTSSAPAPQAALDDRLLFLVRQPNDFPAPKATLWVSDGSNGGTQPLATFVRAADGGLVLSRVTPFEGEAYFAADDGITGSTLWRTDGTASGTRPVGSGDPRPRDPYELVALNDRLLFGGWDAGSGGLWSTDGTNVERISTAIPGGELFEPVVLGDAMIYLAFDETHGNELWRSDGSPEGTELIADLNAGSNTSSIYKLARLGDRVYFAAYDGTGWGLWNSNGAPGGARLVRRFAAPFGGDIVAAGDYVYFTSDGTKLWRSDGTESGTLRLVAMDWIQGLTPVGRQVFFLQGGGESGGMIWTSDGTAEGTRPLSESLRVGLPSSWSTSLASVAGRLVFSGTDGVHGYEPWISDGTAAGTRMLADVAPGLRSSGPQGFTVAGGLVYFSANDGVTGRELWAIPLEAIASSGRVPAPIERAPVAPRDLPPRP